MLYAVIIFLTLLISPFILILASSQNKKAKEKIKTFYIVLIVLTCGSGFFNWETFRGTGRSGFELAVSYPRYFLWLFFVVLAMQLAFLASDKRRLHVAAVVLNFFNTFTIFYFMISLGNYLGKQSVSLASVAAVFLVLIGNVAGLVFINKDKNILAKFPWG